MISINNHFFSNSGDVKFIKTLIQDGSVNLTTQLREGISLFPIHLACKAGKYHDAFEWRYVISMILEMKSDKYRFYWSNCYQPSCLLIFLSFEIVDRRPTSEWPICDSFGSAKAQTTVDKWHISMNTEIIAIYVFLYASLASNFDLKFLKNWVWKQPFNLFVFRSSRCGQVVHWRKCWYRY